MTIRFVLALMLLLSPLHSYGKQDEQKSTDLPSTAFSRLPMHQKPTISPDGNKVAYLHNYVDPELTVLTVFDIKNQKLSYVLKSDNEKLRVRWFEWANSSIIVGGVAYPGRRNGVDTIETRMFSINTDVPGAEMKELMSPRRFGSATSNYSQFRDNVIDLLPNDPEHILVAVDLDKQHQPSVYKLNILSGDKERIIKGKRKIRDWFTDRQGNIRLAVSLDYKDGDRNIFWIPDDGGDWQKIFSFNAMQDKGIEPIGFDFDPHILYFRGYEGDKKVLYKMDIRTQASELVFQDPMYDFNGNLIYSRKYKQVIGISHLNASDGRVYWHEDRQGLINGLNHSLPDTDNYLVDFSQDESQYLVYSESDSRPGIYYFGDRTKQRLDFLLQEYPEIPDDTTPPHQLMVYQASDGTDIEGYLTLPASGQKPYPLVMHPHGGPGARDITGFDYWTAFFASRGYAVFRPNFRGSEGYGYEFEQAQMQSWGLTMQDDIADAANWLVETGVADKNKMCIVGASYGGYAAAMAAVKHPKLFQCGVSFAGVMDLKRLVSESRYYTNNKFVKNQIGDDYDDLRNRSPIYNVEAMSMPLLLVHGEKDRIVDVNQSRLMVDEMEDEDKSVKYVELENGTHYLTIQRNRHILFREMEAFLAKYLH